MPTRVVHRVRCRKKDDSQVWADVKIVDGVTIVAPGGKEMMFWVRAKDAVPFITDVTGDENGKGNLLHATRVSHMEQCFSAEDQHQRFDVEVLDAVVFQPPAVGDADGVKQHEDATPRDGLPIPATFGKGPFGLFMKESAAIRLTVDKTGLHLDGGSANKASRAEHVNLVTEKGNTDDGTDGIAAVGDSVPPQKLTWAATVKTDAINFKVPGGDICLLIPRGSQAEIDTTRETTDPITGDPCPPDNTDPNIYVYFPTKDNPGPPSTGANVKIPQTVGGTRPISQGALWWIERVSPTFRPWFWFATIQEPKAFSFFGSPGRLGAWAWRGFILWNNYPVIWILSRNNAIVPMGQFGSPNLETCAEEGSYDLSFPPVPSRAFLAPGRPPGSSVAFPFSATPFEGSIDGGGPFENTGGPFGPFGFLPMTYPPLGPFPDGVPYDIYGSGQLWDGLPNVWQLTGLPQQKRVDPKVRFDAFTNPYPPPASHDAEVCAGQFRDKWNSCALGHNGFIEQYVPRGGVNERPPGPSYGHQGAGPPGWHWAVPWYDNAIGAHVPGFPGEGYRSAFNNGIPPGVATIGLPLEIYAPATSWTMDVGQLDAAVWDTTKLEPYSNPINFFLPLVGPPVKWPPPGT